MKLLQELARRINIKIPSKLNFLFSLNNLWKKSFSLWFRSCWKALCALICQYRAPFVTPCVAGVAIFNASRKWCNSIPHVTKKINDKKRYDFCIVFTAFLLYEEIYKNILLYWCKLWRQNLTHITRTCRKIGTHGPHPLHCSHTHTHTGRLVRHTALCNQVNCRGKSGLSKKSFIY